MFNLCKFRYQVALLKQKVNQQRAIYQTADQQCAMYQTGDQQCAIYQTADQQCATKPLGKNVFHLLWTEITEVIFSMSNNSDSPRAYDKKRADEPKEDPINVNPH